LNINYKYDAFISFAVEDKRGFVVDLVQALENRGLRIYYSSKNFNLGDDINQEINNAITNSRFGIPIFSEHYLQSGWTKLELSGFVNRYTNNELMKILPIWHGVDHAEMTNKYPSLSGLWSINSKEGVEKVADEISKTILKSDENPTCDSNLQSIKTFKSRGSLGRGLIVFLLSFLGLLSTGIFLSLRFQKAPSVKPLALMSTPVADSSTYYFNHGEQSFQSKAYNEAIGFYTNAININNRPKYLIRRGQVNLLINHHESALDDFGMVIEAEPNNDVAYYERAQCYIALKNIPLAVKNLKEAMRLRHPKADSLYNVINPIIKTKIGTESICCDGTQSKKTGRGACSYHGGVCEERPIYKTSRKY
jgi:tetratricopeptide (TPR) repeat protein